MFQCARSQLNGLRLLGFIRPSSTTKSNVHVRLLIYRGQHSWSQFATTGEYGISTKARIGQGQIALKACLKRKDHNFGSPAAARFLQLSRDIEDKRYPRTHYTTAQKDDMGHKRHSNVQGGREQKKSKKGNDKGVMIDGVPWIEASNDDIIKIEVKQLLQKLPESNGITISSEALQDRKFQEVELQVSKISSTGDGLALDATLRHVYVIPFTIEGDIVLARPHFVSQKDNFSRADFVKVLKPSPLRDDSRIGCRYFASCGGCQFQMMSQKDQLAHKRKIMQDAYTNFSHIDSNLLPDIEATLPSPLQYSYRTKLTPHFDGPPGFQRRRKPGQPKPVFTEVPPIGFMLKNRRKVMDIEECPIGSKAVQDGLRKERASIAKRIDTYSKGATILLRETTEREEKRPDLSIASFDKPVVTEHDDYFETKGYVTSPNAFVKEYIGDSVFVNHANSFFQNNNSILPPFIDYIKERLFSNTTIQTKPKYLVDAYCGSGLFTVTLASHFERSIGVDIDPNSIKFAATNATSNNLSTERASFKTANASDIFRDITFPASETVMVIDPPRKGCDLPFLKQLMKYGPQTIVYVSCNVHTQARDVGFMVNGIPSKEETSTADQVTYDIESLRGCDFFPQTAHVEGVAILRRKPTSA